LANRSLRSILRKILSSGDFGFYADDQRFLWHRDSDGMADHALPHFHALYAEHEALIELRDFRDIRDSCPSGQ
jgi:hypothetical protein